MKTDKNIKVCNENISNIKEKKKLIKNKKLDKKKKKEDKKVFNFKEWIKNVIEKSSKKSKSIPKIKATFKVLFIYCEKGMGKEVVEFLSKEKISISIVMNAYQVKANQNAGALAVSNKEIEIVVAFLDCSEGKDVFQDLYKKMQEQNLKVQFLYTISPKSAELNLIYLLKKGV